MHRQRTWLSGLALAALPLLIASIALVGRGGDRAVIRTLPLDQVLGAVAADARSHHLIVTDTALSTRRGHARLIDATTGNVLATVTFAGDPVDLAIDARTQRAFIGTIADGRATVLVLDTTSGIVINRQTIPASTFGLATGALGHEVYVVGFAPAVCDSSGHCTRAASTILRLDSRTGQPLGTFDVPGAMGAFAPDEAAHQAIALSTLTDGTSVADVLALPDGRRLHVVLGPGLPLRCLVDPRTGHAFIVLAQGPPWAQTSTLVTVDTRRGRVRRAVALPGAVAALALDAHRTRLYVAYSGPLIRAAVTLGGALAQGATARAPGRVAVIDSRSGALLRTVAVGTDPVALALDARSGHVLVASIGPNTLTMISLQGQPISGQLPAGGGTLQVFDRDLRTRLRTIALAPNPGSLLLDPATQRLVLAYTGGLVRRPRDWTSLLPLVPSFLGGQDRPASADLQWRNASIDLMDLSQL